MALVRDLELVRSERYQIHDPVRASYSAFSLNGKQIVQIKTYGRSQREMPTIPSQTIQFDRTGAEAMVKILKRAFDLT